LTTVIPQSAINAIPYGSVVGQAAGTAVGDLGATVGGNVQAGDTTADTPVDTTAAVPTTPDWTAPSSHSIDWSPLEDIPLFDKFPFSLPFDLSSIMVSLVAVPTAPKWTPDIPMAGLHLPDFKFTIDFSQYQPVVDVIRWGELLVFTGGLAFVFYKICKH
jgi:hypothetical protein